MSELGLDLGTHRKHKPRRGWGCLAVLIALAVLVGGGYFAATTGMSALRERFSPPPDYSGDGSGSVLVEVKDGDNASDIAATLEEKDVVKSIEAFTDAARENPDSVGIQVGFYKLHKQMSADSALDLLIDPDNLIQDALTIPEGWTVEQIVARLADKTDFSSRQYRRVLRNPSSIGLPDYANGNPEGYLFPATYMVPPNAGPKSILAMMVDRWQEAAEEADLEGAAKRLGYTPAELMVVASLVEAESNRDADRGKVARL